MTEQEKIKLIGEYMYCVKYTMYCAEVPFEVINEEVLELTGLGFSNYECELNCKDCKEMFEML